MADFCKEYCDNHDPGFPHDFSIEEEAEHIPNGHYTPLICEGYGFFAIGKDMTGKILLYYRDVVDGIPFDELETYYKKTYPNLQ